MNDLIISTIRTFVPTVVGSAMTLLAGWGLELDGEFATALQAVIFGLATAGYYVAVRLIAKRFPQAEALLGATKKPVYVDALREV